jgi:hypothetical protein
MKEQDCKDRFYISIKTLKAEMIARSVVFGDQPLRMKKKIAEIQFVIDLLVDMKDELKPHLELEVEQAKLLRDVPMGDYAITYPTSKGEQGGGQ